MNTPWIVSSLWVISKVLKRLILIIFSSVLIAFMEKRISLFCHSRWCHPLRLVFELCFPDWSVCPLNSQLSNPWRPWDLCTTFCSKKSPSSVQFTSVQLLSCVWLFATPWITACQASLSITNSQSSLKLTSIKSVMPSSHLILGRPLLLLLPIHPSISLFQWVNSLPEVAKVLELQL